MGISQIISKISCFILSWLKISFLLVITYLVSSQFVFICNLVSILSSTFCLNATVWHQTLLWMCLLERRFYRTRVRSLFTLVTNSLTHSLTHWLTDWLLFSKLDWCNPGVWRCQLKTCWCCNCNCHCNCCWWGSCWQQFVVDFEAEVWSKS